jgi:hypothetical protein
MPQKTAHAQKLSPMWSCRMLGTAGYDAAQTRMAQTTCLYQFHLTRQATEKQKSKPELQI